MRSARAGIAPLYLAIAAIEAIVGAGAVYGGLGLLVDPEGLGAKQRWLDGSVFPDYTIPGVALLVVIGGGMLGAAAVTLWARRNAALAAGCMALALVSWGVIETLTIGWRGMGQVVLVVAFVVLPACVLGLFSRRT